MVPGRAVPSSGPAWVTGPHPPRGHIPDDRCAGELAISPPALGPAAPLQKCTRQGTQVVMPPVHMAARWEHGRHGGEGGNPPALDRAQHAAGLNRCLRISVDPRDAGQRARRQPVTVEKRQHRQNHVLVEWSIGPMFEYWSALARRFRWVSNTAFGDRSFLRSVGCKQGRWIWGARFRPRGRPTRFRRSFTIRPAW